MDVVNELCTRLGTSIERLLPTAIDYGRKVDTIIFLAGLCVLIFGVILAIAAKHYANNWEYDICTALGAFAIVAIPVGIGMMIRAWMSLHMWALYPDMKAYKMILQWVSG